MKAIDHVEYLATRVGPRGSCSNAEAKAAEYAREQLAAAGLEPTLEPFQSARSGWWPYTLASGVAIASAPLAWADQVGALLALFLVGAVAASLWLELGFRPNPVRWLLPKASSQNVWAQVQASGQTRRRVVVVGHLDSHRTPLAFHSSRWLKIFGWMMPAGFIALAVLLVIDVTLALRIETAAPWMSALATVPLLGIFAITAQADFTPFTEGANDNATAVGTVLELAERLLATPLSETDVWLLCSGCEEVGCYGADAFLEKHRDELVAPCDGQDPEVVWVTVDSVGGEGADLTVIEAHKFLTVARSHPVILERLDEIGDREPDLRVKRRVMTKGYTESHVAQKHGLSHVTFVHLDKHGHLPNWHRPSDTFANLDLELLDRTVRLVDALLRELDESGLRR